MSDRTYPERPIVGVGGVVLRGDRALVVRRATEPLKGEWSIPGGVLEIGERLREGVAREIREETSLEVTVGEVLDVFDSIFTDPDGRTQYHYVLIDYLCHSLTGEPIAGSDVSEVRWVTVAELSGLGLRQITEDLLRKALSNAAANPSIS